MEQTPSSRWPAVHMTCLSVSQSYGHGVTVLERETRPVVLIYVFDCTVPGVKTSADTQYCFSRARCLTPKQFLIYCSPMFWLVCLHHTLFSDSSFSFASSELSLHSSPSSLSNPASLINFEYQGYTSRRLSLHGVIMIPTSLLSCFSSSCVLPAPFSWSSFTTTPPCLPVSPFLRLSIHLSVSSCHPRINKCLPFDAEQ